MDTGQVDLGGMKLKYTKTEKVQVDPNPSIGDFADIAGALQTTYMEPDQHKRSLAEKFLDAYCLRPNFIATLLALSQTKIEDGFDDAQRKSAIVLLDKKLNYLTQVREYLDSELGVMMELLLKAIFHTNLDKSHALLIRSMITSVTSSQLGKKHNFVWSHFVPLLWRNISQDPASIYPSMLALEAIVMGSENLECVEAQPRPFLSNVVDLGTQIWEEFSKVPNRTEPFIWETAKTYCKLLHTTTRYLCSKIKMEWVHFLIQSESFCDLISKFLVSDNIHNSYGAIAIHFHNPQIQVVSDAVNVLREYLLEILSLLYSKVSIAKSSEAIFNAAPFKKLLHQVIEACCESLCTLGDHKENFHQVCETAKYLDNVVTAEMRLVIELCKKNTKFYSVFAKHHEKMFVRVVLTVARISPKELSDINDDPSEFVNYTADLLGFPTSGTCKAQVMNLQTSLQDTVDGSVTKYFNLLFGVFKECMLDGDKPFITELRAVPAFTGFKPEEFVDVALLLLSSMSYCVLSREDLLELIRGFLFPNIDKILSIENAWIQSRLASFISNYFTSIFYRKEDLEYLKKAMIWMSKLLTSQNKLVYLAAHDS